MSYTPCEKLLIMVPSEAFSVPPDSKKPLEGRKTMKKIIKVILDHFENIDFFGFLGPSAPWENTLITGILAISANFAILKHAVRNKYGYIFSKNAIFH